MLLEHRCTCGKLLFKGTLVEGVIEIKCRSCHSLMRWESAKPKKEGEKGKSRILAR